MYSMTGYGRHTSQAEGRTLTIEIRSVNHRFLDVNFRMPRSLAFMEERARKLIGVKLARGHVDVSATYLNLRADSKRVLADEGLISAYANALDRVSKLTGYDDDRSISLIARLPDALKICEAEDDEHAITQLMDEALNGALDALNAMRAREGEALRIDMLSKLDAIERMTDIIEARYPETVIEYQEKLKARIFELLGAQIDEARLAQEAALMADRTSVAEEVVRIHSHVRQAREKCALAEPVGRSLDFLVQEMNREVNTITSKSQDIKITQIVIDLKSEIEKLREQLQNVE